MIVFRRGPPNDQNQQELLIPKPATIVKHGRRKYVAVRSDPEEQEIGERAKRSKLQRLAKVLSSLTCNLDLKKVKKSSDVHLHDSDGDTTAAGSSHVSTAGQHSLPVAMSHKSACTHDGVEATSERIPMRHHSSRMRNFFAYTDMTGITEMEPTADCRDASHHAFRKYPIPASIQVQPKPKDPKCSSSRSKKDNFGSFFNHKTKCSFQSSSVEDSSQDIGMEDVIGDLPSVSTTKQNKHHSRKFPFLRHGTLQQPSIQVHDRQETKPNPDAQKDNFGSFSVKAAEPPLQSLSIMEKPPSSVEMEEEIKGDLLRPRLSRVPPADLVQVPHLANQTNEDHKVSTLKDDTTRIIEEEESYKEVGDLPPLTIAVFTKQGSMRFESQLDIDDVGDLPPLTLPTESWYRTMTDKCCDDDQEKYPFDETDDICPGALDDLGDQQEQQDNGSEKRSPITLEAATKPSGSHAPKRKVLHTVDTTSKAFANFTEGHDVFIPIGDVHDTILFMESFTANPDEYAIHYAL